jgi:hypothetical protein
MEQMVQIGSKLWKVMEVLGGGGGEGRAWVIYGVGADACELRY